MLSFVHCFRLLLLALLVLNTEGADFDRGLPRLLLFLVARVWNK